MIKQIRIEDVASFGSPAVSMSSLSQFNYIYGANGTGKTTISRIIASEDDFPSCRVLWAENRRLETLVYNRDFVERNFSQSDQLKGIFTLGEQSKETLEKIDAAKKDLDEIAKKIDGLRRSQGGEDGSGGKLGELRELETRFEERCWSIKQKYDEKFQCAFQGVRAKKKDFMKRLLLQSEENSAALLSLSELEVKAASVFSEDSESEPIHPVPDFSLLLSLENSPVLKKKVVGKSDVDIAHMIKKLENSDWVKRGREYFEKNDGTCPFCQQDTDKKFADELEKYFDETFIADTEAIEKLCSDYENAADEIQSIVGDILSHPSKYVKTENVSVAYEALKSCLQLNLKHLENKRSESSRVVDLKPLGEIAANVLSEIESANSESRKHNDLIANRVKEQKTLTSQVWKYLVHEASSLISAFVSDCDGIKKAIAKIDGLIAQKNKESRVKQGELEELEKSITSIQPTIDGINSLLRSFGFSSFSLTKSEEGNLYRICRGDGTDAKETLSEGERTFITFLYFYYLLKGSDSESGMTNDRVVVFDDPVSSLDSDILFVVSSLIKGVLDEVRDGSGTIKQVFILTHNVYFHKEVTFNKDRTAGRKRNDETFWMVRRPAQVSTVQSFDQNPIQTSYELLWVEVRTPDRNNLSIQNTLRRILENYFKILGGIPLDQILTYFKGKEKQVCNSLLSWVNDGSHFAGDDLYISIDEQQVEKFLDIFKRIFEVTNHIEHYRMMMREPVEPVDGEQAVTEAS